MDTLRSDDLMHRQALEILPWYVRRQLGPEELRKMDAHLATCSACRREAAGLARMFAVQEQSIPDRPVDEGRLDALFARIDRYEAERPRAKQRAAAASPSLWTRLSDTLTGWMSAKPALLAAAAAVVLAVIVTVPMLDRPSSSYDVLGEEKSAQDAFRVTFHLKTEQDAARIEEMIDASVAAGKVTGKYRIERRSATEYVVAFEEKPGVSAMSALVGEWRSAPNVADVTTDFGSPGR